MFENLDLGIVAVLVTMLGTVVAFAFGYGILTQKVKGNRADINKHEETYEKIYDKLDDVSERLKGVETKLNERR